MRTSSRKMTAIISLSPPHKGHTSGSNPYVFQISRAQLLLPQAARFRRTALRLLLFTAIRRPIQMNPCWGRVVEPLLGSRRPTPMSTPPRVGPRTLSDLRSYVYDARRAWYCAAASRVAYVPVARADWHKGVELFKEIRQAYLSEKPGDLRLLVAGHRFRHRASPGCLAFG